MKITKAVIPAAGYGTRFLPVTKGVPKEMLPIIDKPTLQYIIEEAVAAGITDILLILSHQKQAVREYFGHSEDLENFLNLHNKTEELELIKSISEIANIHVAIQQEQKGLGHAILCAKEFANNEPIAVLLGDDITVNDQYPVIKQLCDAYEKTASTVVGVRRVDISDINKYGSMKIKSQFDEKTVEVEYMVEKPDPSVAPSNLAVLGRYVLTPKIFDILEKQTPGVGGEIQLTDAIDNLRKHEHVYAYEFEGKRFDVGNKLGMLEAIVDFALNREDLKDKFLKIIKQQSNNHKK